MTASLFASSLSAYRANREAAQAPRATLTERQILHAVQRDELEWRDGQWCVMSRVFDNLAVHRLVMWGWIGPEGLTEAGRRVLGRPIASLHRDRVLTAYHARKGAAAPTRRTP